MKNEKLKLMCISGIFTALIFVFTAYLHIPSHTGYIHLGDGFIFLAACLLPAPYALFTGAVGALLADCLTGFALWAPASAIIKGLTALLFTRKSKNIIGLCNLLMLIPAGILCVGGYYLYEALITGNFFAPIYGIPGNITQWLASSILFVVMSITTDRTKLKYKLIPNE